MTMHVDLLAHAPIGCTCGPYWSVVPPPPCPYHPVMHPAVGVVDLRATPMVPYSPIMTPKELATLYRRLADVLDPPVSAPSPSPTT